MYSSKTLGTKTKMEHRDIIDGFICLAVNWDFLTLHSDVQLPSNVVIRACKKSDFKGVTSICQSKNLVKIIFKNRYDMEMFQLLAASPLVNSEATRLEFAVIRDKFIESIDKAILGLKPNSETTLHWKSLGMTYRAMVRRPCNINSLQMKIFPQDIRQFGILFNNLFSESIIESYNVSTFTCAKRLGQNAPMKAAVKLLKTIKLSTCHEVVIHFAKDFFEKKSAVFWNRNNLKKNVRTFSREFYPGLIGGAGNFIVDYPICDSDEKGKAYVRNLKFYSSLFKHNHRATPAPFTIMGIVDLLLRKKRPAISLEIYKNWLQSVESSICSYTSSTTVYARAEAIISIICTHKNVLKEIFRLVKLTMHYDFKKFTIIPSAVLGRHVNDNMLPPLKTLSQLIQNFQDCETALFPLTPEILTTGSACEALLAYGLYGTATWRNGAKMYPKDLVNILNLNATSLRNQPLLIGLDVCTYLAVNKHKLVEYRGPTLFTDLFLNSIVSAIGQLRVDRFLELTNINREIEHVETFEIVYMLSDVILFQTKMVAVDFGLCTLGPLQSTLKAVAQHYAQKDYEEMTTKEFVAWLTSDDVKVPMSLNYLFRHLRNKFLPDNFRTLSKSVSLHLEEMLYDLAIILVFPKSEICNVVVLPSYNVQKGNANINITTINPANREAILEWYQKVWRTNHGLECFDTEIILKDAATLNYDNSASMKTIIDCFTFQYLKSCNEK